MTHSERKGRILIDKINMNLTLENSKKSYTHMYSFKQGRHRYIQNNPTYLTCTRNISIPMPDFYGLMSIIILVYILLPMRCKKLYL